MPTSRIAHANAESSTAARGGTMLGRLGAYLSDAIDRLGLEEFNLSYTTPRVVRIQDMSLSVMEILLNLVIFAYIVIYEVVLNKGYLMCYPVSVQDVTVDVFKGVPVLRNDDCARRNRTRSEEMLDRVSVNFKSVLLQEVLLRKPPHCSETAQEENQYTCFNVDNRTLKEEIMTAQDGVVELPLTQLVSLTNGTSFYRTLADSSAMIFNTNFFVTTPPYEESKKKDPKLGGALEKFRVRLVDLDGNVVNACPPFVHHKSFRMADTCDFDTAVHFNTPCEFEPDDTHAIPFIAIAKAGGVDQLYTKVKDMHPSISSQLIDSCIESVAANTKFGAYVYKDGYADMYAAGVPQKFMRMAGGYHSIQDISTYDGYLKAVRKVCEDRSILSGGVKIQVEWTMSNVEFKVFKKEFRLRRAKPPIDVLIKVKFSPPHRANGLVAAWNLKDTDTNYPRFEDDDVKVANARWFGTTLTSSYSGQLCTVSVTKLLLTLTASLGLLALATTITETYMLKISPLKDLYKAEKVVKSGDYTRLRKTMTSDELRNVLNSDDVQMSALGKSLSRKYHDRTSSRDADEESTPIKVVEKDEKNASHIFVRQPRSPPHAAQDVKRAIEDMTLRPPMVDTDLSIQPFSARSNDMTTPRRVQPLQ